MDQNPLGSERRAFGIDAKTSVAGTARVQPPHILKH